MRAPSLWFLPLPAAAAALVGLVVLSGCSYLPWSKPDMTAAACPAAVVIRPLANTAIFAKSGMEMKPTDVMFYGVLSEIDAKCATNSDTLQASLDVIIAAERGAATKGDSVDLTYFLAVVGPGDAIISKKTFGVHIDVPRDAKRGGVTDHIDESIPLGGQAASALQIVVGFQQTAQIVDFYQRFRGR